MPKKDIPVKDIPVENSSINISDVRLPNAVLGLVCTLVAIIFSGFSYFLYRLDTRIDKSDFIIEKLDSKYQNDHDKLIKLETIIESYKK